MNQATLQWTLSLSSALMLYLMGRKSVWGPAVGLANQVLWIAYVLWIRQWGLLPGVLMYTAMHAWNLYKWRRLRAR